MPTFIYCTAIWRVDSWYLLVFFSSSEVQFRLFLIQHFLKECGFFQTIQKAHCFNILFFLWNLLFIASQWSSLIQDELYWWLWDVPHIKLLIACANSTTCSLYGLAWKMYLLFIYSILLFNSSKHYRMMTTGRWLVTMKKMEKLKALRVTWTESNLIWNFMLP